MGRGERLGQRSHLGTDIPLNLNPWPSLPPPPASAARGRSAEGVAWGLRLLGADFCQAAGGAQCDPPVGHGEAHPAHITQEVQV